MEACGILFPGLGVNHLMIVLTYFICWRSLADRCNYLSVSILYDIFSEKASPNLFVYYNCNTSCTRPHKLSIVPIPSSINSYRHSFFVNTVFLWNTLCFDMLNIKSVKSFRRVIYHHFCTKVFLYLFCPFVWFLYFVLFFCLVFVFCAYMLLFLYFMC